MFVFSRTPSDLYVFRHIIACTSCQKVASQGLSAESHLFLAGQINLNAEYSSVTRHEVYLAEGARLVYGYKLGVFFSAIPSISL